MKKLTIPMLFCAALAAVAGGLATTSSGGINFAVDTAVFRMDSGDTLLLEVYQEIEIAQLSRNGEGVSVYTTEITLENAAGDTLEWDIWNTPVTWNSEGRAVNCKMFPVTRGDWTLSVIMTDTGNGRQGVAVREFTVSDLGSFSDMELARTIMPAQAGSVSSLRKGNIIVFPAASTRFAIPGESMIYTYQEIYGLGGTSIFRHGRLLNADGVPVFARPPEQISIPEGVETAALVDSFDLTVVREPGLYSLFVAYYSGADTLKLVNRPILVTMTEAEYQENFGDETISERRLDEFTLLLGDRELELYHRLDTEGKTRFYEDYWAERPGEHSVFVRECRVVESRYAAAFRDGWQTDRGRVYIIYGDPDEVERDPFSMTLAPYEVWYYYGASQNSFVFADMMGNGDYLQIHSTVPGESSHSNWREMLQNLNRGGGISNDF